MNYDRGSSNENSLLRGICILREASLITKVWCHIKKSWFTLKVTVRKKSVQNTTYEFVWHTYVLMYFMCSFFWEYWEKFIFSCPNYYEIIFHCLNFGAKNAALTKKRYARVYSIHETIKVITSGILCGETNFIWMRNNILMIITI